MGDLVLLPNAVVTLDLEAPLPPNPCVQERIEIIRQKAEAGDLRSFVLVGEMADGSTCEFLSTCEGDLHVLDSLLGVAQRGIQYDIARERGDYGLEKQP